MSLNVPFAFFFSLLTHPLVVDIFQFAIIALIVGFTSASSIVRPAIVPLILIVQWHNILTCHHGLYQPVWDSLLGGVCVLSPIHYIQVALLDKWAFEACGPATPRQNSQVAQSGINEDRLKTNNFKKGNGNTIWQRFRFGFFALDGRMIGTRFEVKGVPPFSMKDPSSIPTRKKFLLNESMKFFLSYLVLDTLTIAKTPNNNADVYPLHIVPFFVRLNAITVQEMIVRITITTVFWIFMYCFLQVMHSTLAIIVVASGLTDVKAWRPLFGSPSQGYTLRQFWGVFWHQLNRQALSSPASWIAYSFLRLQKGGITGRYLFCFLVFFLSGLEHLGGDFAGGMPWQKSGSVRFFVTQITGVILEDAAQECYRQIGGRSGDWKVRVLGFVWVFVFLVWSTPAWVYPGLLEQTGGEEHDLVPFSIVGAMLKILR